MFRDDAHQPSPPAPLPEPASFPFPLPELRKISQESLVNRVNYLSFSEQPVTVLFSHRRHGRRLRILALPEPCTPQSFCCRWDQPLPKSVLCGEYQLQHLEINCGAHTLQVDIDDASITADRLSGRLAESSKALPGRRITRHRCRPLPVQIIQNGAVFSGILANFNAAALALELQATPPQNFLWLNPSAPVTLLVQDGSDTVLTATADILRMSGERLRQSVVLAPRLHDQRRLPGKKHRGQRVVFCPAPQAVFTHPLSGRQTVLDVTNVSGTGFAVTEPAGEAVLVPGLTLNDLQLRLTESFALRCKAQVVYCRSALETGGPETRHCGLAILDMAIPDHTRLLALMHRAVQRRRGISPPLDLDRLWEFFFASGFIYPEKFRSMHPSRAEFLRSYERLYQHAPEIARHFVIQQDQHILAHMAMLRLASNSWLLQHHAADHARTSQAGLDVLQLAGEAINASQGLFSAHMDYAVCFYRPDNRFPRRVFGGVAEHYQDRTRCSVDTFAYSLYRKEKSPHSQEPDGWTLTPASSEDLLDLAACYDTRHGGGLMLKALDLEPQRPDQSELMSAYRRAGFLYRQDLFALKYQGLLAALFVTMRTAVGLNLSNLTNAITALVIDPALLSREAYATAVSTLAAVYPTEEVPVLTFPEDYPHRHQFQVDKSYSLWAIDCRHLDPYFDYCDQLFRRLRTGRAPEP